MKILITSGGTKIPIDTVRSITNMSHGTLGSRMAKEFLEAGHEVVFFRAEGSKSPMSMNVDFHNKSDNAESFKELKTFSKRYRYKYLETTYKTFEDYQKWLEVAINVEKPDVIILAAAVSDYGVENPMQGKIRTKDNLNIPLKPLPKIISNVRKWAGLDPIIIGFKLLVDVPVKELHEEAFKSINKNKLDCVCANDLRTILNGNHNLWFCDLHKNITEVNHTQLTKTILDWIAEQ